MNKWIIGGVIIAIIIAIIVLIVILFVVPSSNSKSTETSKLSGSYVDSKNVTYQINNSTVFPILLLNAKQLTLAHSNGISYTFSGQNDGTKATIYTTTSTSGSNTMSINMDNNSFTGILTKTVDANKLCGIYVDSNDITQTINDSTVFPLTITNAKKLVIFHGVGISPQFTGKINVTNDDITVTTRAIKNPTLMYLEYNNTISGIVNKTIV